MGCSGQWPVIRRSWWLEAVLVAEKVGHQMDGSRLALVENGELLSVSQLGCDMMKAGRKMSQGQ